MKKLIYSIVALAAMMFTHTSCTNEDTPTEEAVVKFEASFCNAQSRTASEKDFVNGTNVNKLLCAIYEKTDGAYTFVKQSQVGKNAAGGFTFEPVLMKDKTYKIVFWAMHQYDDESYAYTVNDELTSITILQTMECNNDKMDAFVGQSEDVTVGAASTSETQSVTLKRPFALQNFVTKTQDLKDALAFNEIPEGTEVTANVIVTMTQIASSYNALTGQLIYTQPADGTGSISYEFTDAAILGTTYTSDNVDYTRLASNYVWPGENATCTIIVNAVLNESKQELNRLVIPQVPITPNYNVSIYGQILTGTITYNITLGDFDKEYTATGEWENTGTSEETEQ